MTRNHIIISGTGRAGTTFLIQLLTELRMDTGFLSSQEGIDPTSRAGMELDLRQPDAPYIVKSPWICDYLEELLESGEVSIDHAIIPVRSLYSAAESRRFVASKAPAGVSQDYVYGGLWHTNDPGEQEKALSLQFFKLIHTLVKYDINTTFLYFPKFLYQPDYLYIKLWFLFEGIPYDQFLDAFKKLSHPEMIHKFEERQNRG